MGERCCVACVVVMLDWVEDAKREKEGERMRGSDQDGEGYRGFAMVRSRGATGGVETICSSSSKRGRKV